MIPPLDLLPCPFCGGDPDPFYNGDGRYAIVCQHDGPIAVEVSAPGVTAAEAAEAWNTRAPVEITDELVERVQQYLATHDDIEPPHVDLLWDALDAALNGKKP